MVKNTIGQFISVLRKANGMTQQEVADRLNVSNKAVSRWERDECSPDLSVIPVLAEMFGVTCDELLRGERVSETASAEKKEQRTEKQIKSLITRTLSDFKTLIWISLGVSAVGLVCMFGISYGFFLPVVGLAVMFLLEACACVIASLAVSRARDVKACNELFEAADSLSVSKFNNTLGSLSFIVFFVIFAVVLLSFPLVLTSSDYIGGVITLYSYFSVFFGGIVLILVLVYLKCRKPYIAWVTGMPRQQKPPEPVTKIRKTMTATQLGLTAIAGVIFVLAPYLEFKPSDSFSLDDIVSAVGLLCLVMSIVCFAVFLHKQKENRGELIFSGIRNIFFIPSSLIAAEIHQVGWTDGTLSYDYWYAEYFRYAAVWILVVAVSFSFAEMFVKRKSE